MFSARAPESPRLGLAWLGLAWLGLAWLGLAWLGATFWCWRREIVLENVLDWMQLRYVISQAFPNAANIALWK